MKRSLCIGSAILLAAAAGAHARAWPDSSTQVVVFADQLPGSLTAAQRQFAATRLAGTQKQLRSEIQAIRAYNTNFLCLHYQLAVGCGPASFIDGNAWISDWAVVNSKTNWFLLNDQTQRVHQTNWNWDVMNVTYSGATANTAFPQYWITTCLARIRSAEDDGVFADSYTVDGYGFGQTSPSHPWLEDVDLCISNWIPNLERFGAAVTNAFAADGGGFLFLPNLGGLITSWDPMNYGIGHGGMIENFCFWDSWNMLEPDDWRLQMERGLALVRSNKIVICQSYPATDDTTGRLFATTSYLLIKGSRTYLCLLTTGDVALEYYPEYTIDLGGARSNAPPALTNLWYAPWGVYRRGFTNGLVLVNPGASSVSIASLGTNYQRIVPSGGGEVDEFGNYGGSLIASTVTSIVLSAYSGAVLLNATEAPPATNNWAVANLAAYHRSGQTFLTWTDVAGITGEQYRVYRHTAAIAASNLAQATLIYTVPESSSFFFANRYDSNGTWRTRYANRLVISNNAPPLAATAGLLAWTLATNDFAGGTTGNAHYAVTVLARDGSENRGTFGTSNRVGPIAEGVADPLPVAVTNYPPVSGGGRVHIFIQYMDLRKWNPTFHAPHERNNYYGFGASAANLSNAIQYAYDYAVVEPACSTTRAPLCVNLHGWAGNTYEPVTSDPDPWGWCAYKIYPVDVSETWHFGFARNCDYRRGAVPTNGDAIANYTEQRILRMVYDTMRSPPGSAAVDSNRVYVFGHSMGGSGTLALALRYPNVFAAAYASEPMTDYRTAGDGGGIDWRGDVDWKWGSVADNLPVLIDAPGGWAASLKPFEGTGVWDWQNHQSNVVARAAMEIVPLGFAHGTNDDVIEWSTQGRPVYPAFNAARQCWGGRVTDAGHSWQGFDGMPPTLDVDGSLAPFQGFTIVRNETVPGLANGSGDIALPPSQLGGYNASIEWSASWEAWDGSPVDQTNLWQVTFRSASGATQTVDVTPRRLQRFPKAAGTRVLWRNIAAGGSSTSQIGQLAADADGLITITNFIVTPAGNRLRIDRDAPADGDHDFIPDYWESAFGLNPASPSDGAIDSDGDGVLNRDEYLAGTSPRDGASWFAIVSLTPTGVAWRSTPGFRYRLGTSTDADWQPGTVITARTPWTTTSVTVTNAVGLLRLVTPP